MCQDGACTCQSHATKECQQGDVWWFDSCGQPEELDEVCGHGCTEGSCDSCEPDCDGKDCGPDGCGGFCLPGCNDGEMCHEDKCLALTSNLIWVSVPAGSYMMGVDSVFSNEKPVHEVSLPGFELTKSEVTVEQYAACVDAGQCSEPDPGLYCDWDVAVRGYKPVTCVNWHQAVNFCEWAGARLPTEAEWEYAARSGGQDFEYPWGNEEATCHYAVMDDGGNGCGEDDTWHVCSKTAGYTEQGLCDMAGNVSEWVQDWYHSDYSGAPDDGSSWETPEGEYRVVRGGKLISRGATMRTTYRDYDCPQCDMWNCGFRCAR